MVIEPQGLVLWWLMIKSLISNYVTIFWGYTVGKAGGAGEAGGACRDVACYVWEPGEQGKPGEQGEKVISLNARCYYHLGFFP